MNMNVGTNSGIGFGNLMVKHEQELLQKQQLYQSNQYNTLNQPLLPQQSQQSQPLQSYSGRYQQQLNQGSNSTPLVIHPVYYSNLGQQSQTNLQSQQQQQQQPQAQTQQRSQHPFASNNSGYFSSNYSTTSANPNVRDASNVRLSQSFAKSEHGNVHQNGLSRTLESIPASNNDVLNQSSIFGSTPSSTNLSSSQQNSYALPQINPSSGVFPSFNNPTGASMYQYNNSSLPPSYQNSSSVSSTESNRATHANVNGNSNSDAQQYQQLQNFQQLQQTKLQRQSIAVPPTHGQQSGHNNFQKNVAAPLQPLNIQPTSKSDIDNKHFRQNSTQDTHHVYQCHLCEKQFRRKSWLKRHLLSHSNVKKFHCPWCSSTHKRKDNLLQHLKLKHTQYLLHEFTLYGILMNVNNGSGNTANLVTTNTGDKVWLINNEPSITIRDMLESNILPKDQAKRCLNYIVDHKCK